MMNGKMPTATRGLPRVAMGILITVATASASVAAVDLATTRLDLGTCTKLGDNIGEGGAVRWAWPDAGGYFPHFLPNGERMAVGFSWDRTRTPIGLGSLAPFNSLFENDNTQTTTIECVIQNKTPTAAIVLFHSRPSDPRGKVPVVYQVIAATCQLGRIEALANDDGEPLARRVAETRARSFDCGRPPSVSGRSGRGPM